MEASGKPLAQFTTNSFAANPYLVILFGFMSGMGLMSVGIMAGMPVFVSMALLIAGILLVYGFKVGKIQYTLTQQGVEQQIKTFIPYLLFKKENARLIKWNQIKSWKNDTDRMRTGKDYEYLKLYLKTSPGEIWITDQHNPHGFQQFRDAFISFVKDDQNWLGTVVQKASVNMADAGSDPTISREVKTYAKPVPALTGHIREKRSFYDSNLAKVLTVFFTLITILFIWIFSYKGMHFTNWFRLMFIILPGTVYMLYRVFFQQRDKN